MADKGDLKQQLINQVQSLQNNQSVQKLEKEALDEIKTKFLPMLGTEIGTGGVVGFCSGYASRYFMKFAILGVGVGYIGLSMLQNSGYVNVNWRKIEKNFHATLDINNDGKLDEKDIQLLYERYMQKLAYQIPSLTGFGTFFMLGLRGKFLK